MEIVAEGLEFPEGPVAMADGSVLVAEIKARRISRVRPDGAKEVLVETGGGPNGLAIGPDGALWIADNGGAFSWHEQMGLTIPGPTPPEHEGGSIRRFDFASGKIETVYESCEGRRLLGPNDLVFDSGGGLWFTDHGCTTADGRRFGALCYARADGSGISRQRDGLIAPNGVGLSPDGRIVYVADTWLRASGRSTSRRPGCWRRQGSRRAG
jgi:gluconolactonase